MSGAEKGLRIDSNWVQTSMTKGWSERSRNAGKALLFPTPVLPGPRPAAADCGAAGPGAQRSRHGLPIQHQRPRVQGGLGGCDRGKYVGHNMIRTLVLKNEKSK